MSAELAPVVQDVLGWKVATSGFADSEHRILDLELARKLGFARPRTVRDLIQRLIRDGKLNDSDIRRTVRQTRGLGRPATEFWLTMEQALYVAAKSETETADEILKAMIKVFLAARDLYGQQIPYIARMLLAESTCNWDLMWPHDFVAAICVLHGEKFDGSYQPVSLASTYERIYKTLFGKAVYKAMKGLNPEPHFGSNHHQWLTPLARERLRIEIPKITLLAKNARTKESFWAMFDHEYSGKMLQLDFLIARKLTSKAGA